MITYIVPTIGRPSLAQTLASIERGPGDEVIVIGAVEPRTDGDVRYIPCPPGHDWGSAERNIAMPLARGSHLSFMDDDDTYAPGACGVLRQAVAEIPDRPLIFRMRYPDGRLLWQDRHISFGNIGTPMLVVPNRPDLGTWGSCVGGDYQFIAHLPWRQTQFVWRREVIAQIGDNVPAHVKELGWVAG